MFNSDLCKSRLQNRNAGILRRSRWSAKPLRISATPDSDKNFANRSIAPEPAGSIPSVSPRFSADKTASSLSESNTHSPAFGFLLTQTT